MGVTAFDCLLFSTWKGGGKSTPVEGPAPKKRPCITVERRAQGGYTFKLEEITKADPPHGVSSIPAKA